MTEVSIQADIAPLLVLGGGPLAYGVVRAMHGTGVPVVVVSGAREPLLSRSRHCQVVAVPGVGPAELVAALLAAAGRCERKPVLMAVGDAALTVAVEHEALLAPSMHLMLPSLEAARTVLEKHRFDAFAREHQLPVPTTWHFASLDALRAEMPHLPFPLAIKPALSHDWHPPEFTQRFGHIKMLRVDGPEALARQVADILQVAPMPLIQEFVEGGDAEHYSYVGYRDRSGRELAGVLLQKLRLNPIRYGLGTCARAIRDESIERIGREVLERLQYRSVASVCFKRDARTGVAKVFEVNGRLPLNFPAVSLAGVNLPRLMYRDALGLPVCPEAPSRFGAQWTTLSHDVWAALGYRRAGELSWLEWLGSYREVREVLEWDWRDPMPGVVFTAPLAQMAARRVLRWS